MTPADFKEANKKHLMQAALEVLSNVVRTGKCEDSNLDVTRSSSLPTLLISIVRNLVKSDVKVPDLLTDLVENISLLCKNSFNKLQKKVASLPNTENELEVEEGDEFTQKSSKEGNKFKSKPINKKTAQLKELEFENRSEVEKELEDGSKFAKELQKKWDEEENRQNKVMDDFRHKNSKIFSTKIQKSEEIEVVKKFLAINYLDETDNEFKQELVI